MPSKEPTWKERLTSLSAAVRIAIREECRKEQIRALQEGDTKTSDAVERVMLSLSARFGDFE